MRPILIAAMLTSATAWADWVTWAASTGDFDVTAADAGVVVYTGTASATAWAVSPDGGVGLVNQLNGGFVGAALFDGGCLAGVTSSNIIAVSAGCGTNRTVGVNNPRRFRVT